MAVTRWTSETVWQVRIGNGGWRDGIHTFATRKQALDFIAGWNMGNKTGASVELLRDGVAIPMEGFDRRTIRA